MELARIDGTVTVARGHPSLRGFPLKLCQVLDADGRDAPAAPVVAIDTFGAGLHNRVILSSDGAGAREVVQSDDSPLRYLVTGVVDEPERGAR